jgi:hypothetical protein
VTAEPPSLDTLQDVITLWGFKTDRDHMTVYAETSPEDYVCIRREGVYTVVDVYDTPTTLLAKLGDFFHTAKIPARFVSKKPSTKRRQYGK